MPIYNLHCKNCGLNFEVLTSFEKRDQTRCPNCGHQDTENIFGEVIDVWHTSGNSKQQGIK